jgi:hypothetical protein
VDQGARCLKGNVLARSGHRNIQQKVVFLNLDIPTTVPSNLVKFCM